MYADEVSFCVIDQGHEAVLADRELAAMNLSTSFEGAPFFDGAVFTCEINNRIKAAWYKFSIPCETAKASPCFGSRNAPHFDIPRLCIHLAKVKAERALVKHLRSMHVCHVNFKPPQWTFHAEEFSPIASIAQAVA